MVSARDKVAYAISMHRMVDPGWPVGGSQDEDRRTRQRQSESELASIS